LWQETNAQEIIPLIYKTSPGTPRKLREEVDENVSHSKISRKMLSRSVAHVSNMVIVVEIAESHMEMGPKRLYR